MASTYSPNLSLELIGTGDQAGTWGNTTNTNLGTLIEQAISGYVTQAVSTGTDTTITIPNGATGVARNMYIELTGTGGASTNLIVPANKKLYFIFNNTASGQVTVKVSGQTGISVPNKAKVILVSNGTDIIDATNYIGSATIGNLTATSGTITTLTSSSATITNLLATSLTVSSGSTLNGGVVINEPGADVDFRVESDTDANCLFVDASANNVGIGTSSPESKLAIKGSSGDADLFSISDTTVPTTGAEYGVSMIKSNSTEYMLNITSYNANGKGLRVYHNGGTAANYAFLVSSFSGDRLVLDGVGNLGLGVTPSAWLSAYKVLEVQGGSFASSATSNVQVTQNAFLNASTQWIYKNSTFATQYSQASGQHVWYNAPSGTAGNAITFTQAMTLDASGNLLVGTTTADNKLTVSNSSSGAAAGVLSLVNPNDATSTAADLDFVTHSSGTLATGRIRGLVAGANNYPMSFWTYDASGLAERARITSGGLWLVGVTTSGNSSHRIAKAVGSQGDTIFEVGDTGTSYFIVYQGGNVGWNAAASAAELGSNSTNSRSLNASGTLNASGADYAEYMEKSGEFSIAKGDVCGVDANGKLTNVYADAVSFVVKSTNPSYVGGDIWGVGLDDPAEIEAAREKVDRIAFAGQVPVNVLGATPGQYIVPVNDNGAIKGVAVSNPTFEQYQSAVGKVIALEDDGRARIIVKVV